MVIIGENIHVIAQAISTALRDRDAKVIQDLARAQAEAGLTTSTSTSAP